MSGGTGRRSRARASIPTALVAVVALAAGISASAAGYSGGHAARPSPRLGGTGQAPASGPKAGASVILSGSPGAPAANPQTDTLYVPIQCAASFCSSPVLGRVVDVINTAKCNDRVTAACRVSATIRVGRSPLAAVIDEQTDTVYTANGDGTVSVVDGARCNATRTSGCRKPLATIKAGGFLVAAAIDSSTRTLYVASPNKGVFVIDIAACNAVAHRGCRHPVRRVTDSLGPASVDVNVATDTIYAANAGPNGNGDTVSVIKGATCNGHTGSGCGRQPRTVKVGQNPNWVAVDQATNTVYVTNFNDGTVSVLDGSRCNAGVTRGCGAVPPAVPTGSQPAMLAVDDSRHTLFVMNQGDDTLSAIDTRSCRGGHTSRCPKLARAGKAAPDQARGYVGFPSWFALVPATGTAYVLNLGGAAILGVSDVRHCNALHTGGCRVLAANVPQPEFLAVVDPATDTIYAGNLAAPHIDVLNGATCTVHHLTGCAPVAEIPMAHPQANVGAIDDATHTLYASDPAAGKIAVINTATCNAAHTAGCSAVAPTITVSPFPGPPVLDPGTATLYAPFGASSNRVAVVDTATCNAEVSAGCGQIPGVADVADGTNVIALSAPTHTIYAPAIGMPAFSGDTVSVIDGATCNGTNHSGCGHLAATVKVGNGPFGVAVDDKTHTVYVANNANGDSPGTLSMIDAATCNGSDTAGCAAHLPTIPVGRSPLGVAVDTLTNRVFVTDFSSAAVSVVNGSTCNAEVRTGCAHATREQAVISSPSGIVVNQNTNTVFTMSFFMSGSTSIFRGSP